MEADEREDWLLVVEDQLDVWRLLKGTLLRALPNVPTVHYANGPTALSYLQACLLEHRLLPRLILMDLYMPGVQDGLHLLNSLKEPRSGFSHLPIVVMSSSTSTVDYQQVTNKSIPYLLKPVQFADWDAFLGKLQHYWLESKSPRKG